VLVQVRDYYRFELMTMLVLGAIFEIPGLLLALSRAGILSSTTPRRHRRYAMSDSRCRAESSQESTPSRRCWKRCGRSPSMKAASS
jgi:Sec-independent protein translocase protein (TatC)